MSTHDGHDHDHGDGEPHPGMVGDASLGYYGTRYRAIETLLIEKGVWLQGNFRSFTGAEGYTANRLVRQWLTNERYQFLALDMHRPESLDSRLDGVQLLVEEFGGEIFDEMTITAPRHLIFGASDTTRAVC